MTVPDNEGYLSTLKDDIHGSYDRYMQQYIKIPRNIVHARCSDVSFKHFVAFLQGRLSRVLVPLKSQLALLANKNLIFQIVIIKSVTFNR